MKVTPSSCLPREAAETAWFRLWGRMAPTGRRNRIPRSGCCSTMVLAVRMLASKLSILELTKWEANLPNAATASRCALCGPQNECILFPGRPSHTQQTFY